MSEKFTFWLSGNRWSQFVLAGCLLGLAAGVALGESPVLRWELGPTGTRANLRAVSAPSDQVIWAFGSAATVIRSTDGGPSWSECGPEMYAELEYRSLNAFSESRAVVASAGSPAVLMLTEDAGERGRKSIAVNDRGALALPSEFATIRTSSGGNIGGFLSDKFCVFLVFCPIGHLLYVRPPYLSGIPD